MSGRWMADAQVGRRGSSIIDHRMRDDFLILKELGRGAGGVVSKAVHLPSLKVVAIKRVRMNDAEKRAQARAVPSRGG